jgi:hypothetical protein
VRKARNCSVLRPKRATMTQRVEARRPGTVAAPPEGGAPPAPVPQPSAPPAAPTTPPAGQALAERNAPSRGALFAGARGTQQQALERSLAPLAQAAGLDVREFAARFTAQRPQLQGKALVEQGTFAFVQEALTRHPERADALIAVRLRGMSSERTSLVKADVEASGTAGLQRYAQAERAIRHTNGFDKEQLGDIADMVRAGDSLSVAAKRERAEVDRIAREEAAASANATASVRQPASSDLRLAASLDQRVDASVASARIRLSGDGVLRRVFDLAYQPQAAALNVALTSSSLLMAILDEARRAIGLGGGPGAFGKAVQRAGNDVGRLVETPMHRAVVGVTRATADHAAAVQEYRAAMQRYRDSRSVEGGVGDPALLDAARKAAEKVERLDRTLGAAVSTLMKERVEFGREVRRGLLGLAGVVASAGGGGHFIAAGYGAAGKTLAGRFLSDLGAEYGIHTLLHLAEEAAANPP